jgi:hypothetical protein
LQDAKVNGAICCLTWQSSAAHAALDWRSRGQHDGAKYGAFAAGTMLLGASPPGSPTSLSKRSRRVYWARIENEATSTVPK